MIRKHKLTVLSTTLCLAFSPLTAGAESIQSLFSSEHAHFFLSPEHEQVQAQTLISASSAYQKPVQKASLSSTVDDYTTAHTAVQEENAFLFLNQDRIRNGKKPLVLDPALSELARLKSRDMKTNRYFSHLSPTYGSARQLLSSYGYPFTSVAENIAHHSTIEKSQAAFMSSPDHRRNALGSQWSKVGIGVWNDDQGFVYVTQLFVR